ncbi:solute carrier family 23 protein [Lolliginicoccus levis]|uniref:solute carrier family 23 protein n=1 Tax=Lolliginicoccus levis TaxID=2919542 RepID=UPI00241FB395|nr:solute carrier family 23 protein [Lolliginicoccus levis]
MSIVASLRREHSRPAARRHPVDEVLPVRVLAVLGAQHVVAFYAGAVLVPLLIAMAIGLDGEALTMLIMADLFTCGVASILQAVGVLRIGVRLPLVQGVTFASLAPVIKIANDNGGGREGLLHVYGAVIVAGVFTFLIAPYFARLVRFFPPVVTGSVILIIGVSLLPVGIGNAITSPVTGLPDPGNGRWMAYALGTIALIVLLRRVFRGFLGTIAVLLGLVVGTTVAWLLGDTRFDEVRDAAWVGFVPPFAFGWPQFGAVAIVSMIIVLMITSVESTGSVLAAGEIVGKRIGRQDIAAALRADGVATVVGGSFNSFPYTAFNQNVGLVRLTGVKSRWVVAAAGVIMILLGLFPKAAQVVESIPAPVLGGASITLFASVAIVGIQTLAKVDFTDQRNLIIAGTALGLALYVEEGQTRRESGGVVIPGVETAVPGWLEILFTTGITMGAIAAIVLNIVFFHIGRRGQAVAGGGEITLADVNRMDEEQFHATFGPLVHGTWWVTRRAFGQAPFADAHDLRAAFQEAMLMASDAEKLELLRAFPDLGAEDETGTPIAADHVALSTLQQGEHLAVVKLATAYRMHFGFPLIICAREIDRFDAVLRTGASRLDNQPASERAFALVEVAKIMNYRFDDLVAEANPVTDSYLARLESLR